MVRRVRFQDLVHGLLASTLGRCVVVSGTKTFLDAKQEPRFDFQVAHIISPVPWEDEIQDAVLKSLAAAKHQAEDWRPSSMKINVSIHLAQAEGEAVIDLPVGFKFSTPLRRTTATEYGCRRALPFAVDMMRTLQAEAPSATLYVLSNADIAVTPEFYQWVAAKYLTDVKAMNILKVMIPRTCRGQFVGSNLTTAYEVARRLPQTHPGSDMFVWEASQTDRIIKATADVFFGYPPVGQAINDAIGRDIALIRGEHLTFHFGSEGEHGRGDPHLITLPTIPDECSFESEDTPPSSLRADASREDCDYLRLNFGETAYRMA